MTQTVIYLKILEFVTVKQTVCATICYSSLVQIEIVVLKHDLLIITCFTFVVNLFKKILFTNVIVHLRSYFTLDKKMYYCGFKIISNIDQYENII